jgi:xanthine dehydrogenase small subunit
MGAGVSYTDAAPVLLRRFPQLTAFWNRIGGQQVRNMGTVGGNIANGSPIGDTPPPLIALGATVTLRKGEARRTLNLEDFFIAYGKQDRQPGEFVESIFVPALPEGEYFAAYKISKRRDEDISAVCGAFRVAVEEGIVRSARIAFGGMAATPKRAKSVEAALVGRPWSEATMEAALPAFAADYQPITDMRASAEYRLLVAQNLLRRFFLETTGAGETLVREVAA